MTGEKQPKVGAVIVAAGASRRMGGLDKVWAPLAGKPVLARAIDVFQGCASIHQIVVVVSKANLAKTRQLVRDQGWSRVTGVCTGGSLRQESVVAGLEYLGNCDWVVVHDGDRPLVTGELITSGLEAAQETGAATAAVPVTDTLKVSADGLFIQGTPPRQSLWVVQTPQVFRGDIITRAHQQIKVEVTDDSALVERLGCRVKIYMGSYDNIKITTPQDLVLVEILWRKRGE